MFIGNSLVTLYIKRCIPNHSTTIYYVSMQQSNEQFCKTRDYMYQIFAFI